MRTTVANETCSSNMQQTVLVLMQLIGDSMWNNYSSPLAIYEKTTTVCLRAEYFKVPDLATTIQKIPQFPIS